MSTNNYNPNSNPNPNSRLRPRRAAASAANLSGRLPSRINAIIDQGIPSTSSSETGTESGQDVFQVRNSNTESDFDESASDHGSVEAALARSPEARRQQLTEVITISSDSDNLASDRSTTKPGPTTLLGDTLPRRRPSTEVVSLISSDLPSDGASTQAASAYEARLIRNVITSGSDADDEEEDQLADEYDEEEDQLAGEYDETEFAGQLNYGSGATAANNDDGDYTDGEDKEEEQDDDQDAVPHDMPLGSSTLQLGLTGRVANHSATSTASPTSSVPSDTDEDLELAESRRKLRLLLKDPKFSICGAASIAAAAVWAVVARLSFEQRDRFGFLFEDTGVEIEKAAKIIATQAQGDMHDMKVYLVPHADRNDKVGFEWLRPNRNRNIGLQAVTISRIFHEFAMTRDWRDFVADVLHAVCIWPERAGNLAYIDQNSSHDKYSAVVLTANDANEWPTRGAGFFTVRMPLYAEKVDNDPHSVRLWAANHEYIRKMIAKGVARDKINYFIVPLEGDAVDDLIVDEAARIGLGEIVSPDYDAIDHSVLLSAEDYILARHHDLSFDQVIPESARVRDPHLGERYWAPIPGVDVYQTIEHDDDASDMEDDSEGAWEELDAYSSDEYAD